jgi:hypothetical protein
MFAILRKERQSGFTLIVTLLCLLLFAGVAFAMLSLAAIELRASGPTNHQHAAQTNARLALMLAIGQLQQSMGSDTRVSANSALVTTAGEKHWTGVWNTLSPDGRPWITRDPANGSLVDHRRETKAEVMRWLVSGGSSPEQPLPDPVTLVGKGSVTDPTSSGVRVPAQEITTRGQRGRLAWWTGDLGQRANLASTAAPQLIGNAPPIPDHVRKRLVSENSVTIHFKNPQWVKDHFHDFTVHSRSTLTDNRNGGLKKDLSVFLHSEGETGGSGGLRDTDRLAGPAEEEETDPFLETSPRFGVLRHWAGISAPDDLRLKSIPPETVKNNKVPANHQPARLDGITRTSIQPILIEASQLHSFSWHEKPGNGQNRHHLRKHLYPRIALWNPYPIALEMSPVMVLLQINGRHDFWIDGHFPGSKGKPDFPVHSPWVAFDGGRSRDFVSPDGSVFNSPGFTDPHMGSYYYQLPTTRFEPGECLVFTPPAAAEYRDGVKTGGTATNLAENILTPEKPPHPGRCLTISDPPGQQGFAFIPTSLVMESTASYFALFGMRGVTHPTEDLRVIIKDASDRKSIDVDTFDQLPQLAFHSGSLQYGAGRGPEAPWAGPRRISIEKTGDLPPTLEPDGRTRQGLALKASAAAPFANWNPRAIFSLRSPREEFQQVPKMPHSFGIYQPFLPTADASWSDRFPFGGNGRQRIDPLGRGRTATSTVLFDIPRKKAGVRSLAFLQHAKLSELVWQPSRAVGNSLADPRIPLTGTLPEKRDQGGFVRQHIGHSNDRERSPDPGAWEDAANAILQGLPEKGELIYDLSYEANHTLWDRYFLSGSDADTKKAFSENPLSHLLENTHLELSDEGNPTETAADLRDFHRAASRLTIHGAFNVNSLSESAWASVLAGNRRISKDGAVTAFPRIADSDGVDSRELTDDEIRRLARAIVSEVKRRGPFLGMADFVNRRLAPDETGHCGALEAAIRAAGINDSHIRDLPMPAPAASHPPEIPTPLETRPELKPASVAWGEETFLTQADILQTLGDSLVTRSDTFVIRAYGESLDRTGRCQARAWCEAIVQRTPVPVHPDETGIEPLKHETRPDFGRRFRQVRFRWLSPDEI